jgi:ABC-type lipoprotein export system ATPase subunit
MSNLFEISHLKCSYDRTVENAVLTIDHLVIPQGKVVFFVGPSGIGKSTILETLGLMNNTIAETEIFLYDGISLHSLWQQDDDSLSAFRRENFSFIFQQCNLMQNFSALENVVAPALIQCKDSAKAYKDAEDLLRQMEVLDGSLSCDRPVYEFSGGQQQRIAFARAILPDFKVLFGDEPTGNLDPGSADTLMRILMDSVHGKKATAIIVSHDMKLATAYADVIVRVYRKDGHGMIDSSSVLERRGDAWSTGESSSALATRLIDELSSKNEK